MHWPCDALYMYYMEHGFGSRFLSRDEKYWLCFCRIGRGKPGCTARYLKHCSVTLSVGLRRPSSSETVIQRRNQGRRSLGLGGGWGECIPFYREGALEKGDSLCQRFLIFCLPLPTLTTTRALFPPRDLWIVIIIWWQTLVSNLSLLLQVYTYTSERFNY